MNRYRTPIHRVLALLLTLILLFSFTACGNEKPEDTTPFTENRPTSETETEEVSTPTKTEVSTPALSKRAENWISDINDVLRPALYATPGITEHLSEEEREAILDTLVSDIAKDSLADFEICLRINELIASLQIAHISYAPSPDLFTNGKNSEFYILPIGGMWFSDGYRIANANPAYTNYFGYYLTAINGVEMDEILERFRKLLTHETEVGFKNVFQQETKNGFITNELQYLKIVDDPSADITVTLTDENGKKTDLTVFPLTMEQYGERGIWNCLDYADKLPYNYEIGVANQFNAFTYDIRNNCMYLQYNECWDSTCGGEGYPEFAAFFDQMIADMTADSSIDTLIVDLRWNTGGNENLWNNAVAKHKEVLSNYKIKMLIGMSTFSAAVDCIDTTLEAFDDVVLYGEETGQAIHNYTDTNELYLPKTNSYIYLPTKEDYIRVLDKKYTDLSRGVLPDVEVVQSYRDFVSGIDTVYEKAISE